MIIIKYHNISQYLYTSIIVRRFTSLMVLVDPSLLLFRLIAVNDLLSNFPIRFTVILLAWQHCEFEDVMQPHIHTASGSTCYCAETTWLGSLMSCGAETFFYIVGYAMWRLDVVLSDRKGILLTPFLTKKSKLSPEQVYLGRFRNIILFFVISCGI